MAAAKGGTKSKIPHVGWFEARPAPVVLISGPESFLADRAARAIRDQLKAAVPETEVHDLEASGYAAGEIFTIASPSSSPNPDSSGSTGSRSAPTRSSPT
ncbi:hypothetical protein AB3K78_06575 [Leucobacter sp. HNU]|uniref:hypothetical protein n=1 Tax=Leucobacter sp. HNU TaxID=3236805 RepID=UPI003A7FFA18